MTDPERSNLPKWGAERRASPRSGSALLRRLRGLFVRPLALERKGLQFHLVLVDRRSGTRRSSAATEALCVELGARLLNQSPYWSGVMLHLKLVHEALEKEGWSGVKALPSRLLAGAAEQADMLCKEEASAPMDKLVERLSMLQTAAEAREERSAKRRPSIEVAKDEIEVSEATHEEYQELKRNWAEDSSRSSAAVASVDTLTQSLDE
jgi:hypothetical protein